MNEQHVQIITLQVRNGLPCGFRNTTVHVVPDLGHDEEVLSFHHTLIKGFFEFPADLGLVAVAGSTVKQPVTDAQSARNGTCHVFCADPV